MRRWPYSAGSNDIKLKPCPEALEGPAHPLGLKHGLRSTLPHFHPSPCTLSRPGEGNLWQHRDCHPERSRGTFTNRSSNIYTPTTPKVEPPSLQPSPGGRGDTQQRRRGGACSARTFSAAGRYSADATASIRNRVMRPSKDRRTRLAPSTDCDPHLHPSPCTLSRPGEGNLWQHPLLDDPAVDRTGVVHQFIVVEVQRNFACSVFLVG